MQSHFGAERVFDTSLSEDGIMGRSAGMALAGLLIGQGFAQGNGNQRQGNGNQGQVTTAALQIRRVVVRGDAAGAN